MEGAFFTEGQARELLRRMGLPLRVFAGLMLSLGTLVLLGATTPFPTVWAIELAVLLVMVASVLLFSMEILREPPLIRLYSVLGFCWLCILFGMTLIDYLTRGRWPL